MRKLKSVTLAQTKNQKIWEERKAEQNKIRAIREQKEEKHRQKMLKNNKKTRKKHAKLAGRIAALTNSPKKSHQNAK